MNENARSLNLIRTILLKSNKRVLFLYYPTVRPQILILMISYFCCLSGQNSAHMLEEFGDQGRKKGVLNIYFYYFDYVKI